MKSIYKLIIATLIVVTPSCTSKNEVYLMIEQVDHLLDADSVEKATMIFQQIDTSNINSEEISANYSLIQNIVAFRNYEGINTDSAISHCAAFFQNNGNKIKYATARYYQSCIQYELDKTTDAVINAKKAEEVAEQISDYKLLNKIYMLLTLLNYNIKKYDLAIKYARQQIETAEQLNSNKWKAYAYLYMVIINNEQHNEDSVSFYIDKCLSLAKYLEYDDNSYFYSNLGEICLESDSTAAEKYFLKALSYKKLSETYANLYSLYRNSDPQKASLYKDSALHNASQNMQIEILRNIAQDEKNGQNYTAAIETLEQIIHLKDTLMLHKRDSEVLELEKKYDFEKQRSVLYKTIAIFMFVILVGMVVSVLINIKKKSKIKKVVQEKNNIEKQKMQIEAHNAKLAQEKAETEAHNAKLAQEKAEVERQNAITEAQNARLLKEKAESEKRIAVIEAQNAKLENERLEIECKKAVNEKNKKEEEIRNIYIRTNLFADLQHTLAWYNEQIENATSDHQKQALIVQKQKTEQKLAEKLALCQDMYDRIKRNKTDPTWTKEIFDLFIGYYENTHPKCKAFFLVHYENLVTIDKLYLILSLFEKKTTEQICDILAWSDGTVRSRRSKVKTKQILDFEFC